MAEIADAVGLGVSSIYYYFANKHEVLERIVDDVNRVPLAIADQVIEQFDDAPCRLHAFIRNDAATLCEFPFDINEIHRLAGDDRDLFADYWTDRQRLVEQIAEVIDDGVEAGVFRHVDAGLCALTILSNDEAVQNWYRVPVGASLPGEREQSPDDVGEFVADLAVRGLLVDPASIDRINAATNAFVRPLVIVGE